MRAGVGLDIQDEDYWVKCEVNLIDQMSSIEYYIFYTIATRDTFLKTSKFFT